MRCISWLTRRLPARPVWAVRSLCRPLLALHGGHERAGVGVAEPAGDLARGAERQHLLWLQGQRHLGPLRVAELEVLLLTVQRRIAGGLQERGALPPAAPPPPPPPPP